MRSHGIPPFVVITETCAPLLLKTEEAKKRRSVSELVDFAGVNLLVAARVAGETILIDAGLTEYGIV
jgi:hypothetical protein